MNIESVELGDGLRAEREPDKIVIRNESGENKREFRKCGNLHLDQLWDEICRPILPEMVSDNLGLEKGDERPLTRVNRLIVLEHLYAALREGVSSTVLHHLMAAIREIERG